jgi:hypothetical protein
LAARSAGAVAGDVGAVGGAVGGDRGAAQAVIARLNVSSNNAIVSSGT